MCKTLPSLNYFQLFILNFRSRKKAWLGTVTGTLSNHNPDIFVSGFNVVGDAGWWRLTYNQSPKFYWNLSKFDFYTL